MFKRLIPIILIQLGVITGMMAQSVTSPKEHFGYDVGTDYELFNFTQTEAYFKKIAGESDRIKLETIGKTAEGREQYMLIVTSPENHTKLERYKEISTSMARAEGLSEEQARAMSKEGKAVVWIDGGLHATEVVGTHQLIETIYQISSRTDEETMNILDNVVIMFVHANPDGQELVSDWYMRNSDTTKRSTSGLPVLYQKYIGHDNNRDFYIQNMVESQNMGYQLFVEWIPQIMYNHHQRGPAGSVLAGPPYRDPFNYLFEPLMVTGIDAVGAAMYNRLITEDKPGFTRMTGSTFSVWYNGGLRTTTHYHNMIGILTEIIGGPSPEEVPLVPSRLLPNSDTPYPVTPQKWHFRQSIDYSVSLNYALLDYAARNKDHVLYNIYSMGRSAINKGKMDNWTPFPKKIDEINAAYKADMAGKKPSESGDRGFSRGGIPTKYYDSIYQQPSKRDPRAYIISADQADFGTAVKYINALIKTGIKIEKANADFQVMGKTYPKNSYVVKTDQAFRAHVIDMFDPQDYPNDFEYPGGPPIRPYDAAGWTLAYQMGVEVDRILDPLDEPFETLTYGVLEELPPVAIPDSKSGYLISSSLNEAFPLVNALLKDKAQVFRSPTAVEGLPAGSYFIPAKDGAKLKELTKEIRVPIIAAKSKPAGLFELKKQRIALYDSYGGSMPSGWVRWMLEQNGYDFELIFAKEIDAGNLNKKYDMILFISGGIPAYKESGPTNNYYGRQPDAADIPEEFRYRLGTITPEKSIPQLKLFIENGGKVLTVGNSASLAYHLELPVKDGLTEINKEGKEEKLSQGKYYVPGSVLRSKTDPANPSNWGMREHVDVMFNNSMVFKMKPEAELQQLKVVAWFDSATPLRSGWAWGQSYLEDGVIAFTAPIGKGQLMVFTPEITFRAQSHGTFKWLFNNLYGMN
ncbi:M14 family metallopeptidase [Algoriphagus sp. AGSA1]|uniref:M14 family metallopeptidase n=1 Tax=Algoriphagus sp. AGSA1 TaxID=2907213 RepID=UPI001F25DCAE|nr:M14 metallopeptidase family protein [Algoriphagus sp. AGSA1]MCE7054652.1 M14 family metallopeptidase [Algoriphagus sp. AGSA1]